MDPLAGKYLSISPYNYVYNNPINAFDPDGKEGLFAISMDMRNKRVHKGEVSADQFIEEAAFETGAALVGLGGVALVRVAPTVFSWILGNPSKVDKIGRTVVESFDEGPGLSIGSDDVGKAGKTVLGKFPDYINLAGEIGANKFNIPTKIWNKMSKTEQWRANKKFLDRMIERGDEIILSNPIKNLDDVSGVFRQELDYLIEQGYRLNDDGTEMIR